MHGRQTCKYVQSCKGFLACHDGALVIARRVVVGMGRRPIDACLLLTLPSLPLSAKDVELSAELPDVVMEDYVVKSPRHWVLKASFNGSGMEVDTTSLEHGSRETTMENRKQTLSLSASWRGLDFQKFLAIDSYWVFNHMRFSYPAAFGQSSIQKKSAGSVLPGASLQWQDLETSDDRSSTMRLTLLHASLGAGYGYKFVYKGWLFHISAIPTFVLYSDGELEVGETKETLDYRFPEVIITGRGAIVYNQEHFFAGASMVYTYATYGGTDQLRIQNETWKVRLFIGGRL